MKSDKPIYEEFDEVMISIPPELLKPLHREIVFSPNKDNWALKISENGMVFNREIFPNHTPDDFAKDFIDILEQHFNIKFYSKNKNEEAPKENE